MSDFCRIEIVNPGKTRSAVGLAAYLARTRFIDDLDFDPKSKIRDFRHKADELFSHDLLLPEDAPISWKSNPELVWNEAQKAEIAKSTGWFKYGVNCQLAKTAVAHIPINPDLDLDTAKQLATEFAQSEWGKDNLAVQVDLHAYGSRLSPDTNKSDRARIEQYLKQYPEAEIINLKKDRLLPNPPNTPHIVKHSNGNYRLYMPHIHYLVSMRKVTSDGFSKTKFRDKNPKFAAGKICENDHWRHVWRNFQNAFFERNGINLKLSDSSLIPTKHLGSDRFKPASQAANDNAAISKEIQEMLKDPGEVLEHLTKMQAVFTRGDLHYLLKKNGITGTVAQEIKEKVLNHENTILLLDVESGKNTKYFTTQNVRDQEINILELSKKIKENGHLLDNRFIQKAVNSRTMTEEQLRSFYHSTSAVGLAMIQGRAGAGKSYTIGAVRDANEDAGNRVIGLAPTNSVAADMAKDGFSYAKTLHAELFALQQGRAKPWNSNTVVIVDEAGMIDSDIMEELLKTASKAKAKVILVGDSEQLPSVGRGGMFKQLCASFGASLMKEINRQKADWQKQASFDLSEGRILSGLSAYNERGFVRWSNFLAEAKEQLLDQWLKDHDSTGDQNSFIYASTNRAVDDLNYQIKKSLIERGSLELGHGYETERGPIHLAQGDRIQFYQNAKKLGILNGSVGTVLDCTPKLIKVRLDNGKTTSFNPTELIKFGYGWAGTVYRGQGKTQLRAYALYDSAFAWSRAASYVAMTRHKESINFFVSKDLAPSLESLANQIRRNKEPGASLEFITASERKILLNAKPELSEGQTSKIRTAWNSALAYWHKIKEIAHSLRVAQNNPPHAPLQSDPPRSPHQRIEDRAAEAMAGLPVTRKELSEKQERAFELASRQARIDEQKRRKVIEERQKERIQSQRQKNKKRRRR